MSLILCPLDLKLAIKLLHDFYQAGELGFPPCFVGLPSWREKFSLKHTGNL